VINMNTAGRVPSFKSLYVRTKYPAEKEAFNSMLKPLHPKIHEKFDIREIDQTDPDNPNEMYAKWEGVLYTANHKDKARRIAREENLQEIINTIINPYLERNGGGVLKSMIVDPETIYNNNSKQKQNAFLIRARALDAIDQL